MKLGKGDKFVLHLYSVEVRIYFYCILEMQIKNKLMDEKKIAYFIRQSLNMLPKFVFLEFLLYLRNLTSLHTHIASPSGRPV